jgi:hypothetical protein
VLVAAGHERRVQAVAVDAEGRRVRGVVTD